MPETTNTAKIEIRVTDNVTPRLRKLSPAIIRRRGQALNIIAMAVKNIAISNAYQNTTARQLTGRLGDSIKINTNAARGTATVFADRRIAPHAAPVEMGARPHQIFISRGPFAGKTVNHPGNQGKFYMYRAAQTVQGTVKPAMVQHVRMAVKDVGLQIT